MTSSNPAQIVAVTQKAAGLRGEPLRGRFMRSKNTPLSGHRAFASILLASLLTVVAPVTIASAEGPQREQEVRVPGIGVTLKAGWQLLFQDGCRYAVPVSWRESADGDLVLAPDGSNLSVRRLRITNWSTHKAQIKAAYGHVNVHEDSDRRLWLELGDQQRTQHYIDVVTGLSSCAGVLEIRSTTPDRQETANRIANSIGPTLDR